MVTTHELSTRPNGTDGGAQPATRDSRLAPAGRRLRTTELAVGIATVVVFALAGLLWHLRSVDRVPALTLATSVERGDTIETADLRLTHVSSDDPLPVLPPEQAGQLVGRTAVADLSAGTLLTDQLVVDVADVGPDDGVVGLLLEPGQYPTVDLAAGDVVDVVATGVQAPAGRGEVVAVHDLTGGERKLVSLRAASGQAGALAALDQRTLRLVRVGS